MIELRKIRHFVEVARHSGFARAAEALHITQSALTKSVQSIEQHLGITLLERGARGVRLTPDGEWFMERAARVLAEMEEMEVGGRAVRDLRQGHLRIGAAPASLDTLLRDPLAAFVRRFPGIRVAITANTVEHIGVLLLRGEIDLAIGTLDSLQGEKGLDVRELYTAPVSLFVRRGHPLDSPTPPTMKEIFQFPMIGSMPAEPHHSLFRKLGIQLGSPFEQPQIIASSFSVTQRVIEQTDAFSFVFEEHADSTAFNSRFRSWPDWHPVPPMTIDVAWRTGWQPTRAAQEIINAMSAARQPRPRSSRPPAHTRRKPRTAGSGRSKSV